LTVTLLDGLVLARSTFESSMHYRSAMVLGTCTALTGEDKVAGLDRIVDHLMPGRRAEARPPSAKELAQTAVLSLPLLEWSLKVAAGPPADPPEDVGWPIWAGTLPMTEVFGAPADAPDLDPAFAGAVPDYVRRWHR
jgi:hypothetical protein